MKNIVKYCKKCDLVQNNKDKYCKRCGTELTCKALKDIRYESSYISAVVYGPPYSVKYVCGNCGKVYIESGLGSPSAHYCPKCGAKYNDRVDTDDGFSDFDDDEFVFLEILKRNIPSGD